MEKYPLFNEPDDTTVLKFLPDDDLELILSNIYFMVEGQVKSFIKKILIIKKNIF